MRPIVRGPAPQPADFTDYRDAFAELVARLGLYCTFCERRIPTNLAVEHIQPKGLAPYAALIGRWDNFLLACVNCNATKGDKDVVLADFVLPDRDNTAYAYVYDADGSVRSNAALSQTQQRQADATLALCGLDKAPSRVRDANGQFVAIDRYRQRMETWGIAVEAQRDLALLRSPAMIRAVCRTALGDGFFSVWMTVFAADPEVRQALIEGFKGTSAGCFDAHAATVTPRPANGLADGAKC